MQLNTHTITYTKGYSETLKFYQMANTRAFIQKNIQKSNFPACAYAYTQFGKKITI